MSKTHGIARGRDVKKMEKPYKGREVVHTCSNGWTVEKVISEEFEMEGFFMGHCLGKDTYPDAKVFSLREPDGTPHVTVYSGQMVGRCNQAPKAAYAALCREYNQEWVPYTATDYASNWSKENRPDVSPEV